MTAPRRPLRIPAAIAVTVLATGGAFASLVAVGCEGGKSPPFDAGDGDAIIGDDGGCSLFCIPDGTDAGVCPSDPIQCADDMGNCPAGCRPVG